MDRLQGDPRCRCERKMMMKLFKMLPLVGLLLSVSATSALAVGKDSAEDATGKMCAKLTAALIKQERKPAAAHSPGVKNDADKEPAVDATAL